MFSKFSRIGSEPVKWQFTVHITKLSLPSLKSACVVLSRGDSKVSTPYTEPVKGYFTYPEPLTLTCTLYRKRDKGGNGVYLPKEGEVRILEKGKAKEAGVVALDFSEYVSESRSEVESQDNNWRIEKTADKYNNFMIVNIAAKRLGPGGAEEGGAAAETAARKEEVKEADGEEEEEDEAEKEEREWKKRNALPASKGKQATAKQTKWRDEEEEEDAEEDDEDEPLEEEEDDSPKKKPAPSAAAKSKPKAAAMHDDDDSDQWSEDEDDIIKRLKGLKAEGKLAPVGKPVTTAGKAGAKVEEKKGAAAAQGKPVGAKKDKSQMTAKELLFADSSDEEKVDDEEEQVKPKRGAAGKAAAAVVSKAAAGKEDKGKAGSKTAGNTTAGRPAKALNWEVVIPSASSSPHSATSTSASTAAAALPPAKPIPANRLFSCTLPESNTVYPSSIKSPPPVPYILTFLLQQLEKCNALLTPQLFKQYVDPSQLTALRTQLESGSWKLKGSQSSDPHALGGVLKQWVGGLQDGLVGEALVADVLEVGMMEGEEDEDVAAAVKRVSARLSPLHRASLVALLQFLLTMTLPLNARKNGMKAESLASAWGAAIVRMKDDPKKSAYDQFSDKANVNRFVQFCMQHLDAVKAATGGAAAAGKAAAAARPVQEEEAEEDEDGGEEGDEVLKEDEEDEEGEEEAVHDESDGEVAGLKFHHDHDEDEEEEKPKAKGKPLTARERLDQEKQEREKQKAEKDKTEKAKVEREKADKEKVEREKAEKLKADKEKVDRERKDKEEKERKEKERKEREEKERKEKEKREKEDREKREREERERKEKEKLAVGKKGAAASAAAFKPANVFGDSDLDDDEDGGEQLHDDEDDEEPGEDEGAVEDEDEEEEEVKTIQPKGRSDTRPTSPPVVPTSAINANSSNRADRELISRQQTELDSLRKQLADAQAKPPTTNKLSSSSSADDVNELKTKLVAALKEKDAAMKDKREADRKLTALETERESQKKMIEKLQKMLVAKGKIDATQLTELNDASSKGRASPAPPPPPPAGGAAGGHKLSEHLGVLQLKYDAVVEEMEQKLANEKQIRKQLKQQLEQLTEENSNLRQRSMHFDQLVTTSLTPPPATSPSATAASQGSKKTKDELLLVVSQQYERISFLEHTMRENEAMMRQAKQAWADSARIMEDEMAHKDDELQRMKEGYEAAVQEKGVEWVGEEEWRKRVERLKRDKERCEREKKELEDEVRGKRVELQEAMKSIVGLEDDTRLLKEELTRTGIALKTIAEDNFELKEWMRLHSKGKKG